ncbi:MAG: hypothetical protein QOE54_7336, partial [Streptosporangiaceae bacterium]|nr:hypothetical protein [Streptosporangiaceae bacterium]
PRTDPDLLMVARRRRSRCLIVPCIFRIRDHLHVGAGQFRTCAGAGPRSLSVLADGRLAACPELPVVRPREGSPCKSGTGQRHLRMLRPATVPRELRPSGAARMFRCTRQPTGCPARPARERQAGVPGERAPCRRVQPGLGPHLSLPFKVAGHGQLSAVGSRGSTGVSVVEIKILWRKSESIRNLPGCPFFLRCASKPSG